MGKASQLKRRKNKIIKTFDTQIIKVEAEIRKIIRSDSVLKNQYQLVTSVKGVGLVLGVSFIVYTNGFTSFSSWRKFASYSGIAPFEYSSGTSVKGKTNVSHLANKKLKAK